MKSSIVFCILLVGCHTVPEALPSPAKPVIDLRPVAATPIPSPNPPPVALEAEVKRQRQVIEALISQNDALTERLGSFPAAAPVSNTPVPTAPPPPPPTTPAKAAEPALSNSLVPNADGLIDLAAIALADANKEPINPFAVRIQPAENVREVTLSVRGIVEGSVPCAIVNDRLVQAGDAVEALTVTRVERDAVEFRHGEQRFRIPVSAKGARVRLPL